MTINQSVVVIIPVVCTANWCVWCDWNRRERSM